MTMNPTHLTKAAFRNDIRKAYRERSGEAKAKIARLILRAIAQGYVTDAGWKAEFGKTDAQYFVFKARLEKLRDALKAIQDAKAGDE
jgi:hypothetical protein